MSMIFGRVLAACLLFAGLAAPAGAQSPQTGDLAELRELALTLVNRSRAEHGLPALALGPDLNEAAQAHAADMLARRYYSHVSPEGRSVMDRFTAAGGSRFRVVRENIARCSGCAAPPGRAEVERLHKGWMDSPEHRHNILADGLSRFGFGIATAEGRPLLAVQTFAGAGISREAEGGGATRRLRDDEQAVRMMELLNRSRREAGLTPLRVDEGLSRAAESLLGRGPLAQVDLGSIGALSDELPPDQQDDWRSLAMLAGRCGGCGAVPTAADLHAFAKDWLGEDQHRRAILDPDISHVGFALKADGEGQKVAILVLGRGRQAP